MSQFKRNRVAVVMGFGLLVFCGASLGLGLGHGGGRATMGERLSFTVPLRLEAGEYVDNECLAADVYFGDDKVSAFNVAATVARDGLGTSAVHVATLSTVNEPVITVYVAAGCFSRITRKYVVLADPPGMTMPSGAPVLEGGALASAGSATGLSAGMPSPRKKRRVGLAHRDRADGQAHAIGGGRSLHLTTPDIGRSAHLQLDPVAADALVAPTLRMGTTLSMPSALDEDAPALQARRASAAAYWRALQATPEQLAKDQVRLVDLEQRVAELQAHSDRMAAARRQALAAASAPDAAHQDLVTNEDEVREIRIVGLACVALFGLAAYAYMLWQRREAAVAATDHKDWWQGWMGGALPGATVPAQGPGGVSPQTTPAPDAPAGAFALEPAMAAPPAAPRSDLHVSLDAGALEPRRWAVMDELIDLAQQADLFAALGQDDAAQDLLEDHLQQAKSSSPWPYLALLEIGHKRGQRQDYERTRRMFDARFHGCAPDWADAAGLQGRHLAEHAEVFTLLQAAWPQPEQAMALLEGLVCHPDDEGTAGLGLLAYKELLTLYAAARDAAARGLTGGHVNAPPSLPEVLANTAGSAAGENALSA